MLGLLRLLSLPVALTLLVTAPGAGTPASAAGAFAVGTYDNEGYTLVFDSSGQFRYLKGERVLVEGEYQVKGDAISLTDLRGIDACKGQGRETGRYQWALDNEYLSLTEIQDACAERIQGVAGRWKHQPPKK